MAAASLPLSNQGSGSQMEYTTAVISELQWADYADHGLYLDGKPAIYRQSQRPGQFGPAISTNRPGTNTMSDNAGTLASTISGAEH